MSTSLLPTGCTRMIDDFEKQEVRSSGELWSEICSSLPEVQTEATPESSTDFKDSFHPPVNGQANGTDTSPSSAKWEPMEDSEIYIATLGISFFLKLFKTTDFLSPRCLSARGMEMIRC